MKRESRTPAPAISLLYSKLRDVIRGVVGQNWTGNVILTKDMEAGTISLEVRKLTTSVLTRLKAAIARFAQSKGATFCGERMVLTA